MSGCIAFTPIFSGVFGMDDPNLFIKTEPLYILPLPQGKNSFILMQGIGGKFSHSGNETWAFDWAMPKGTSVYAARKGIVVGIRNEPEDDKIPLESRKANYVRIRHDDGSIGVYAHIDTTWMAPGRRVESGEVIALSGNTGFSTRPHLHFHVERDGRSIPIAFMDVSDELGIPRAGRTYRR